MNPPEGAPSIRIELPARNGQAISTKPDAKDVTAETRAKRRLYISAGLFLLALAFRYYGIVWGAADRIDLHPDEMQHVMGHALSVSLADPDPKFLNYPSFVIYLIAIANGVGVRLGLVTEPWQSYVVGRSIVAAFGAATVPAIVWLTWEVSASTIAAALAGLWLAMLPLHVWESHFAVTDVVMTFWIVVALAMSVRLLRRGELRDYALTGAALGFGIASKYTAALAGISPLVATLLASRALDAKIKGLLGLGIAALACAFIGTPFSFLHFAQFRDAMAFEYRHVHSLHYGFSLPAAGWQYHKYVYELCASFPFSLGVALYASVVVGSVWGLAHLRRESIVVASFAVTFFALLGHWTFTPLRYQLPVLVVGVLFAALWQASWIESGSPLRRGTAIAAVAVVALYTAAFSFQTTERLRHDTRIEAARWLDATLKPGERLLLCGFTPYLGVPTDPRVRVRDQNEDIIGRLGRHDDFDLVEITGLHYWRHRRHGNSVFEEAYRRLQSGEEGLHLVKRFDADFLNRGFYRGLDPMFAGYFISPTLEFYARSNSRLLAPTPGG